MTIQQRNNVKILAEGVLTSQMCQKVPKLKWVFEWRIVLYIYHVITLLLMFQCVNLFVLQRKQNAPTENSIHILPLIFYEMLKNLAFIRYLIWK